MFNEESNYFNDKFLTGTIYAGNEIISEKIEYLTAIKNLQLPTPKFKYEVNITDNFFEVSLVSENLIKNLFIDSMLEYNFSDNYFDLIPNQEKVIRIKRDNYQSVNAFKESLNFLSLYETY